MHDPNRLRRETRRKRNALSAREQALHSAAFAARFRELGLMLRTQRIAAYLANNGELDPVSLFDDIRRRKKQLYLPVLRPHPQKKLWFIRYREADPLAANRFGIPEPPVTHHDIRLPWALDLILVPLVAFDARCNRLGMGGGFYDRTLNYLRFRKHWRSPILVGVAHECQRVPELPPRPWDVPLDMVITEQTVYRRRRTEP